MTNNCNNYINHHIDTNNVSKGASATAVSPGYDDASNFDFDVSHGSLLNTGNSPGDCDEIGLCYNFVDTNKIFPYIDLTVHSASYETDNPSKTIDHKSYPTNTSYAWNSNNSSPSFGSPVWIIYEVKNGPKNLQFIGVCGSGKSSARQSPNAFQILVSTTDAQSGSFIEVYSGNYVNTSNDDWSQQSQWFNLGSSYSAKYIKLNITSAQADYSISSGSDPVGIQEFYAVGPRSETQNHSEAPAPPSNLRIATNVP
jgi:hypothetical protein